MTIKTLSRRKTKYLLSGSCQKLGRFISSPPPSLLPLQLPDRSPGRYVFFHGSSTDWENVNLAHCALKIKPGYVLYSLNRNPPDEKSIFLLRVGYLA